MGLHDDPAGSSQARPRPRAACARPGQSQPGHARTGGAVRGSMLRWAVPVLVLSAILGGMWPTVKGFERMLLSRDLVIAVSRDDATEAEACLARGANPNAHPRWPPAPWSQLLVDALPGRKHPGWAAIVHATVNGRFRCVEPLLRHGALPDAHGPSGTTPLGMVACGGADPGAIRALLAHGANPNAHNIYGATPLLAAALTGSIENVRTLLKYGADPNARDRTGGTALMNAAAFGSPELLRLLIAHGADPNARTREAPELRQVAGSTALMQAASLERTANVVTLLAHGADPTPRDADGHSAADLTEDPALAAMLRKAETGWRARHPSGSKRGGG